MLSQVWWVWWPIWGIVVYSQCGLITVLDVGVPCLPGGVVWCILTEVSVHGCSVPRCHAQMSGAWVDAPAASVPGWLLSLPGLWQLPL